MAGALSATVGRDSADKVGNADDVGAAGFMGAADGDDVEGGGVSERANVTDGSAGVLAA